MMDILRHVPQHTSADGLVQAAVREEWTPRRLLQPGERTLTYRIINGIC